MILVNNQNWEKIKKNVFDKGFDVVDNFLNPQKALDIRKEILNNNTVDDVYATYTAKNYDKNHKHCSVISKELGAYWPELSNSYERGWSFIYDNKGEGVGIHQDYESVLTLNIWLTLDKCVEDKEKNGLIIYPIRPPKEFLSLSHEELHKTWINYLNMHKHIKPFKIDYKFNRAVFNNNFLHETNGLSMKDGKENKRVSLTLLFGNLFRNN